MLGSVIGGGVLEGDLAVLGGVSDDPILDLLRFGVVLEEFVLAETGGDRFDFYEDTAVLFFCLRHSPFSERSHRLLRPVFPVLH